MRNKLFWLVVIVLISPSMACENSFHSELVSSQKIWNSIDSVRYSYIVSKQCFCAPEYTREMLVQVENDAIVSAIYVDTNKKVSDTIVSQLSTIDEWFHEIIQASKYEFGELSVIYDKALGYPKDISIDPHTRRSDDEYRVFISNVMIK